MLRQSRQRRLLFRCAVYAPALMAALLISISRASADLPGERIYVERCATCHGKQGEGVAEKYAQPLVGDKSVSQLAAIITETMPEDDPETCTGDDASAVAAYIYDAFYSPIAQARLRPPRIELSRLTVRQYHQTVADLVGSFIGTSSLDEQRGLAGEYFNSRNYRRDRRVLQRVDPTISFDFGEASPDEKIEKDEFSVRWQGSLIAPETGTYEFVVSTANGMKLWVNQENTPLIDAAVRSGEMAEYRESIRLLGGRAYPVKLEFFKSKEKRAAIQLFWKPPHQTLAVIPERYLSPMRTRETLIIDTQFPPDDRSVGYERGSFVSKEWDQATTHAAIEAAEKVAARLRELTGTRRDDEPQQEKAREFCRQFAERAFRRPLSPEQHELYLDRQFAETADLGTAVQRIVLLVLKSPRFLYREVSGQNDSYDVAARLSFALWDSLPDDTLRQAAANNQLQTSEQVAAQAERMVRDPRARAKLREFFHQWLKFEHFQDLSKDSELFPEFDPELVSDMRVSLDLFLEDVIRGERADFRELLVAEHLYLNDRLAKFYGYESPGDARFQKTSLDPNRQAGVLTHPYLMTGFAYHSTSSPIHRGVFVARSLLGRVLNPPADAVTPLPPELHPDLTTRDRIALQTSPPACAVCHEMINPLGFSLEQYDAVGRFRTEERARPIDPTGSYNKVTGETANFRGARELANFLADSDEVHTAFVKQLFQYTVKQPIAAYGPDRLEKIRNTFAEREFNINGLLVEIAVASAFTGIETTTSTDHDQTSTDREQ